CDDGLERADAPLMVGGIVVSGIGGAALIAGFALTLVDAAYCNLMGPEDDRACVPTFGLTMMGGGLAVGLGAGLPMALVGSRKEPRDAAAAPGVIVDPGHVTLRWSF